jgi:hypothetical protein
MFPMQPCKRLLPGETVAPCTEPSPRIAISIVTVLGTLLLGGVSDHYRFLHGLIVGDQRGLGAAYGKLASGSAPATAPGEHEHRRSENEQDKSHELKTAAVTANHQIADATTMPAIGPSLSITRG